MNYTKFLKDLREAGDYEQTVEVLMTHGLLPGWNALESKVEEEKALLEELKQQKLQSEWDLNHQVEAEYISTLTI